MSNDNIFDALEICLQALEHGGDLESCLARFPALTDDLRPILTVAVQARSASVNVIPAQAVSRGRARILQAAAEMREQASSAASVLPVKPAPLRSKTIMNARFFRLALTTALMLAFLLSGGAGLVNASSTSLPGEQLYPVKRSWEDLRLFFVLDSNTKKQLAHEFENERVEEIEELYSEKRTVQVDFQGDVQSRSKDGWIIDGLNIAIEEETNLAGNISVGATVHVVGETDDGIIKAIQIRIIATPAFVPSLEPNPTLGVNPNFEVPSDDQSSESDSQELDQTDDQSSESDSQESDQTDDRSSESDSQESDQTDDRSSESDSQESDQTDDQSSEDQPTEND